MTLKLAIHEKLSTRKLTNLSRCFCYVVSCEKEIPRDAQDTLMEFSQWVESTH
jgi:hypothetical protein